MLIFFTLLCLHKIIWYCSTDSWYECWGLCTFKSNGHPRNVAWQLSECDSDSSWNWIFAKQWTDIWMEMPWVWLHNWNFNLIFQNMHLLTYFFFPAQMETVNAETAQMMKCMSLKKTASQILLIFSNILLLWGKHLGSENGLNLILLQNASQSLQKNSQMSPSGKQHVEMSLKNKYF